MNNLRETRAGADAARGVEIRTGVELVCGQIIGGEYCSGALYYNGRRQGPILTAQTVAELHDKTRNALAQFKQEYGRAFAEIYPLDAWESRVLGDWTDLSK